MNAGCPSALLRLARAVGATALLAACDAAPAGPDPAEIRDAARAAGMAELPPQPQPQPASVALGRALFFDPVLSGRRDVSCASCHDPAFGTTDRLSVSIGVGGVGRGTNRVLALEGRRMQARNAPDLFNRAWPNHRRLLLDGGVAYEGSGIMPPEEAEQPYRDGVRTLVAAAALFHVTQRFDMRGNLGDLTVDGAPNEISAVDEDNWHGIWDALAARIGSEPRYAPLLRAAFASQEPGEVTMEQAAEAISDYVAATFDARDSAWDRFVAGDDSALDEAQLRGAELFLGRAGCVDCHGGPLLSGLAFANIGVPFVGPGQEYEEPYDFGRGSQTGVTTERYAFRTPSLRNVTETGPWMHNGAYTRLEPAIRHHLDVRAALRDYDWQQLKPALQRTWQGSPSDHARLLSTLDARMATARRLSDAEVEALLAFMGALTDQGAIERAAAEAP